MREAFQQIDRTNVEHAGYALAMQIGTLILFGWLHFPVALAAGTLLGIGFFAGREHAQAEKRLSGRYADTTWKAFDLRLWDWNSRWDLIFPAVACAIFAALAAYLGGKISWLT